jgi:hypothetical protein
MGTNQKWACYRAAPPALQIGLLGIIVILLGLIVFLSACTSLYPMEGDAKTVQEQIRDGKALQQGDHVRVVTKDGVSRILTVASVEGDVLKGNMDSNKPAPPWRSSTGGDQDFQQPPPEQEKGEFVEIPIVDIVLIEKEKVSTGKTAAAIGGGAIVFLALPILALLLAYAL